MFDTHCHLTFPEFSGSAHTILDECDVMGVTGVISIATTVDDALAASEIAASDDRIWCSAGVHPLYADKQPHDWAKLVSIAHHDRCVAWGELGLDNHYSDPPGEIQNIVLDEQLSVIEDSGLDLPVVLHCREAYEELIEILRSTKLPAEKFVFHCFTAGTEEMKMILDFGAWVSFTGVLTYKNAPEVRKAAQLVPLDRVMFETDAPYLTPEPHRKIRPNHPKFSRVTAEFFAELRKIPWPDLHTKINRNTERFFCISEVH